MHLTCPVCGERLGVRIRRCPLSGRGNDANRGSPLAEGNNKGQEAPGRCCPTPGIGGCWEPGACNEPWLSQRTYSVGLVRKTPAMGDASPPGGLCSGQRARVSCIAISFRAVWPRRSTFPLCFPKRKFRDGSTHLLCRGPVGWVEAHTALTITDCSHPPRGNGVRCDPAPALRIPGDILLG